MADLLIVFTVEMVFVDFYLGVTSDGHFLLFDKSSKKDCTMLGKLL